MERELHERKSYELTESLDRLKRSLRDANLSSVYQIRRNELLAFGLDEEPAQRAEQFRAFAAAHGWRIAVRNHGTTALLMAKAQPWLSRVVTHLSLYP